MFIGTLQGFSGTQGNPVKFPAKIFAVYFLRKLSKLKKNSDEKFMQKIICKPTLILFASCL